MEKSDLIELLYYILIFFILAVDINNYKLAKNYIDKIYINYIFYTKNKWKYFYKFYLRDLLLLLTTYSFYHYLSLFILMIMISNIMIEIGIMKKIMLDIKLKNTRTKIKSPIDIIDMVHINHMIFDIEDIKYKYEKGQLNNYLFLLPYFIIFTFIIIEHLSIIQFNGGV